MNRMLMILGVLLIGILFSCDTADDIVNDVVTMPAVPAADEMAVQGTEEPITEEQMEEIIVDNAMDEVIPTSLTFSVTPMSVRFRTTGQQFTVNVDIALGENVAGYQVSLAFDATALRYVSRSNGDYLPAGAFVVPTGNVVDRVLLSAQALAGTSDGNGTLATVTFEVVAMKRSSLQLSDAIVTDPNGVTTSAAVEHAEVIQ